MSHQSATGTGEHHPEPTNRPGPTKFYWILLAYGGHKHHPNPEGGSQQQWPRETLTEGTRPVPFISAGGSRRDTVTKRAKNNGETPDHCSNWHQTKKIWSNQAPASLLGGLCYASLGGKECCFGKSSFWSAF